MSEKPKKIFLISPVSFDNKKEERRNLKIIDDVIGIFNNFGFEVMDIVTLLKEANKKKNDLVTGINNKRVSNVSWANFCLLGYLCGNMAFCDYMTMVGNIDNCIIAGSLLLNGMIMQIPIITPVSTPEGTRIRVEANEIVLLPYVDYDSIKPKINGSAWGNERKNKEDVIDVENTGKIPPIDNDLGRWFDTQFKPKKDK